MTELFRLQTTTANGEVLTSSWTMTKEDIKKQVANYKRNDKLMGMKNKYKIVKA